MKKTRETSKEELRKKVHLLEEKLKEMQSAAIAFSGGIDSSFLLKKAKDILGEKICAVTLNSALLPGRDLKDAAEFTKKYGIRHFVINQKLPESEDFIKNARDRCYHCKKEIYKKIFETAEENNCIHVIDGQNFDDLNDYRPGSRAAAELGARSPLQECGFTKYEIRLLSKEAGISGWDKPASACLASRIEYEIEITEDILKRIEELEEFLREKGFKEIRVRHHGNIARIEIAKEDFSRILEKNLMHEIVQKFKESGYLYATLDLEGYKSGSMNKRV